MTGNGKVYICAEGINSDHSPVRGKGWPAKYHTSASCPALASRYVRAENFLPGVREIDKDEAESLGWTPCKRCHM